MRLQTVFPFKCTRSENKIFGEAGQALLIYVIELLKDLVGTPLLLFLGEDVWEDVIACKQAPGESRNFETRPNSAIEARGSGRYCQKDNKYKSYGSLRLKWAGEYCNRENIHQTGIGTILLATNSIGLHNRDPIQCQISHG